MSNVQLTVETAANKLMGVNEDTKQLLKALDSVKTFKDGVKVINDYAQIGRSTWVMTALVVNKTFSTATAKEASKLVAQFQNDLQYSRAQIYNYRKAGVKILECLSKGELKSIDDVPANMSDFIRPDKKVKEGFTLVVDECIGEIKLTTNMKKVYRVHLMDNKDKVSIIATDELKEKQIDVSFSDIDGKTVQVASCGETKHEVDGVVLDAPCYIEYKVLPL